MKRCAFVLLACLLLSSAKAEIPVTLQGQVGGTSRTVDVSPDGTLAYLGVGPRLVILDLSDPKGIRELGRSQVLPEVVQHVVVAGDYAFVADGLAGLYVLDVSDPAAPTVVGRYETASGPLWSRGQRGLRVCLSGKLAYLCDGSGGLHVLDVSNPAEPACIATLQDVEAYDVDVEDGYAYVGTSNQGLLVLDVSDPAHPQTVGQFEVSRNFLEVEVASGYAYAVGEAGGPSFSWALFAIDVRDPSKPVSAGRCDLSYHGGLAIDGKIAYVTNDWKGIEFIRITNPASPARISGYDTQGFALAVTVRPGRLYVAASASGLEIVNISNLAKPVAAGLYTTIEPCNVAVSEGYAYVASTYTGLQVADVSEPCVPRWISSLDLDYASCVCVGKACVWVGDGPKFMTIDVSNPLKPKVTSACEMGGWIDDIALQGSYAYATAGGDLVVLDVSNPHQPALVSRCKLSSLLRSVCVSGRYAYVGGVDGLDIVDISNPAAPSPMGRYSETGDWPFDVALYGDYAYLAHGNPGMRVVDISDPWLPGRVREIDADFAQSIVIQDHYGYLTDLRLGVQVFDVSDPATLARLGGYGNAGFGKIAVSGDYIYAADWNEGLSVLKIEKSNDPEPDDL